MGGARIAAVLFGLTAACTAASIDWRFEGGSLERAEAAGPAHFRLFVNGEKDQDGRNRQASWYYFRVDGASTSGVLTLDMVGLPGEYNYQANRGAITGDTPPLISYDRVTWTHVEEFEYDAGEPHLRLRIRPKKARFWIAHTPPYTGVELESLRKAVRGSSFAREEKIGKSVEGRDLLMWIIGQSEAPRTVWLMFRQHAWESGSSWAGDGAVRALLADAKLRAGVRWIVLPFADPDGVAHGGVRFNRHGYDLNRNWDVEDARLMPEIAAQKNAIRNWLAAGRTIDLFFTLHNTETNEYLEGPAGALAERFFQMLESRTTFAPARGFSAVAPNRDKGRSNVVQHLGPELKIPAFLMEQRIAFNKKLGHLAEIPDRVRFGRELVEAMHDTIVQ